ncbi:MAG: MltA domain-containing protein [Geobacteraceae bacterium]|nr:MltA domain-containing protein [Geobacteraceae bacterium]
MKLNHYSGKKGFAGLHRNVHIFFIMMMGVALLTLAACSTVSVRNQAAMSLPKIPSTGTGIQVSPPTGRDGEIPAVGQESFPMLKPADWERMPAWRKDRLVEAWPAWIQSCRALGEKPLWKNVCARAANVDGKSEEAIRDYFQSNFSPYEVIDPKSGGEGLVTGYYEPIIRGDRNKTARARYPIYSLPPDLVSVELSSLYPELRFMRLRGRLVGNKLKPYYTREEIGNSASGFSGAPIAWAEDPVDLFFLQIQGSGQVEFPDGERFRIGYADQNGHPFRSVAKMLIELGELKQNGASMQAVRKWGRDNPSKIDDLLNRNPSYVFFREVPDGLSGPLGALGVPLTGGRSIAVDPRHIPLGAPLFLATFWPLSDKPLNRLMLAQDTGGAIRGAVRADFYWGCGVAAGELAGRMKQKGRAWVLMPCEYGMEKKGNEMLSQGGMSR